MARYDETIEGWRFVALEFTDGTSPFTEWYDGLQRRDMAKVERAFMTLAVSLARHSDGGRIGELGSQTVKKIYGTRPGQAPHLRITIPKTRTGKEFLLIHGFKKRGKRTRQRDITRAENLLQKYLDETGTRRN